MSRPSQATILVALVQDEGVELWHDADGRAWITLPKSDHREHYRLRSATVRAWLSGMAYRQLAISPGSEALSTAVTTLEGIAVHEGSLHEPFIRIGAHAGSIFLDLANPQWQAIEITRDGWFLVDSPPVRFRRAPGMLPLPMPSRSGRLSDLRQLLNVVDDDWPLVSGYLVQAIRDKGAYPVLTVHGEQGSAKSTATKILRNLIDPNKAALRSPPREIRDLAIAAGNAWVMAYDNLSHLPQWLSDALCMISTGGGFATRSLYTDDEEALFDYRRPVIINGIAEVAVRGDLIDRSVPMTLLAIPEDKRWTDEEVNHALAAAHPSILGGLLDAAVTALRRLPDVHLARKPRMADFAQWVVAAEPGLGLKDGSFLRSYALARSEAIESTLETSRLADWLRALAQRPFVGTATELLDAAEDRLRHSAEWPKSGRAMSQELRRLIPLLRHVGVLVKFYKEPSRAGRRMIKIYVAEQEHDPPSESSDSSESSDLHSRDTVPSDDFTSHRTQDTAESDAKCEANRTCSDDSDGSDAAFGLTQPCSLCSRRLPCKECAFDWQTENSGFVQGAGT